MKCWTAGCPGKFDNRQALIEAEIARIGECNQDAMKLYERAVASAHENGFLHHVAAGCYSRRDAAGKVRGLERPHPWLATGGSAEASTLAERLDTLSVASAQRTIWGEIRLDRLAQTLLRIVMENAGARTGKIDVTRDGVEALDYLYRRGSMPMSSNRSASTNSWMPLGRPDCSGH